VTVPTEPHLHWRSLAQLRRGLAAGEFSSLELTRHLPERTARHDGARQRFIHLADDALEQARASDRRRGKRSAGPAGPFDGVPVALKDNDLTTRMPTTAGSTAQGIAFAAHDSACAERLRAAGALLGGTTRTHEFAWGTTTPPIANPWGISRVPGGSSGGSGAAVAEGFVPLALGSDTGGSVRIRASFCGVVGLKPTFGRISRDGIVPHSWSLDHPGPLARSVEDDALALGVLAGHDPRDPACQAWPVPDCTAACAPA
jgi:aspartyl-tRNA(Asn)/glutamyl-tRNA(Gln) amidotransferase subunit A